MNKASWIARARRWHLLGLADELKLGALSVQYARRHRAFRETHPDYPVPPLRAAYDAYGHIDWDLYRSSGLEHAQLLHDLISPLMSSEAADLLEWGCGPGRIIRHLAELGQGGYRLYGADINASSIAWCQAHLPGITFSVNALSPPLAFDDASMDVVIARSIFTHLSVANHAAWRDELLRVLRPGGLLVMTTQGDHLARMHLSDEERTAYDRGELVVRSGVREGTKWFSAWQPETYMRDVFAAGQTVMDHRPGPVMDHFDQDLWLIRKHPGGEFA